MQLSFNCSKETEGTKKKVKMSFLEIGIKYFMSSFHDLNFAACFLASRKEAVLNRSWEPWWMLCSSVICQQRKPTASWAMLTAVQTADQGKCLSASAMCMLDHVYSTASSLDLPGRVSKVSRQPPRRLGAACPVRGG